MNENEEKISADPLIEKVDENEEKNSIEPPEEKEDEIEEEPSIGVFSEKNIFVNIEEADKIYHKGYYGQLEEDKIILAPVEALLLLRREKLIVKRNQEDTEAFSFEDLLKEFLKYDSDIWVKYLVYRDLRGRGYMVRIGYGDPVHYRVYPRGATIGEDTSKYLICILIEGKTFNLEDLDKVTKLSKSVRKKLVLAVVDGLGEITYYIASQVSLKK